MAVMQKPKFDISDILNKAVQANEEKRKVDFPSKGTTSDVAQTAGETGENKNITGEISNPKGETDEIIKKYSQKSRVTLDEKTSTDALREMLNSQMANDRELFNYYRSFENRKKSKKVEELYNLINFATQTDLEERAELDKLNGVSPPPPPILPNQGRRKP